MKTVKNFFPVGATYAPLAKATEVDISEWDADIRTMAASGLNTFRIFIAWDRIEQKEGVRDFSKADHAFELANKYGMKVIVNAGGTFSNLQAIYPPRWLYTKKGCTILKEQADAPERVNSPRIKLCYDDPAYQKAAMSFITDTVKRYRDNPALLAYSAWNEPRATFCYCKHTLEVYRKWLRKKYKSLDALVKAWSMEFPLHYDSWEEVYPQKLVGFEHGGYTPFIDWKKFCCDNRGDKFKMVAECIRKADPEHLILSHLCGPHDVDIFDSEDIPGTSMYSYFTRGQERGELTGSEQLQTLSFNMSSMNLGNRKTRTFSPESFWVLETEAGPVSWVHNLMPHYYNGRRMNARDMIFVGNGSRSILRWLYRSRISDAQAGEFNLVGWDGSETARSIEFGKLGKFLNCHAKEFTTSNLFKSGVAVLAMDENQDHLMDAEEIRHKYKTSPEMLFTCLRHAGYCPEVLNDRLILEDNALERCKALFIPFRPFVGTKLAAALEKFVKNGGLLVVESPFAIKNEYAIHWEITPGGGLKQLFDAQVYDLEKLSEPYCGKVKGFDFKAIMRTGKTCKVESKFADGAPALISNNYGKGKAVMFASIVSMAYDMASGEKLRKILSSYLADAGLPPTFELDCSDQSRQAETGVYIRSLGAGKALLTVVSMSAEKNHCKLSLGSGAFLEEIGSSDAGTVKRMKAEKAALEFEPYGWAVFTAELK